MSIKRQLQFFLTWLASVMLLSTITSAQAAELALAQSPLFLGTQIDPNVFFMLDDSGSMDWEILTMDYQYYKNYWDASGTTSSEIDSGYFRVYSSNGNCTGDRNYAYIYSQTDNTDNVYNTCSYAELEESSSAETRDWRIRSPDVNIMYYNPAVSYSPWIGFSKAIFTAAHSNPQIGSSGFNDIRNLTGFQYDVWIDDHGHTGNTAEGNSNVTDGANSKVDLYDSHTTYTIETNSIEVELLTTADAETMQPLGNCDFDDADDTPPYIDCFGTASTSSSITGASVDPWGRTYQEVQDNVANWYQYHRRRSFVMKSAVATVVNTNASFKFGLSLINEYAQVFVEVPGELIEDYTAHNDSMLGELFDFAWESNGTPLRRGLERVGRYYSNYYGSYTDPIISACQQNYSILFTDGFWNGSSPYTSDIGDEDGDGASDSLADVAHYFYTEDLSNLPDDVPTTPLDQNDAQHMVSFTVAFGVEGNLVDTDADSYPNPELEEDGAWNDGSVNTQPEKIDDLWHAAFNSKAYFLSAQSTEGVAAAIAAALLEIADRVGSSASVATNTGSLNAGSTLFQARFDSADWKGQLLAYPISGDGQVAENSIWEAGSVVNAQNFDSGRTIITWNPDADVVPGGDPEGQGIPFRFPADYNSPDALAEFTSTQIAELLTNAPFAVGTVDAGEILSNQGYGEDIANYLRGERVNEGGGQGFRLRNSVLGDIVNSDPKFVETPTGLYSDALEVKPYSAFITSHASRTSVVYAGANDGMLHGFNGDTGTELIAYVPNAVFKNLDELPTTDYIHRYFVDAGPNIVDVFMANMNDPDSGTNGLWRTALVGGLSAGGQGIYALDITDPSSFSEANAANIVLWEFDDSDDADLGYTYGRPQLAKMADGSWVAIFGNGYNNTESDANASSSGNAVLFIVDVETGALLKKIDTGVGSVGTPNGLATPLLIDTNGDFVVDFIYAGDLLGNLWKFDVSDVNPTNWGSAFSSGGSPIPLFTAVAGQQITSQPQAAVHPDNLGGFMIYFGTGKYLETSDNDSISQTTQAFYGIWDKNEVTLTAFSSSDLLVQSITNQFVESFDTDEDGIDDQTFTLRDVGDLEIDWDVHMGWKLDLMPDNIEGVANTNNFGERQVSNAILRNGRLIFTTLVPSIVECEFGGTSFLMELDYRDGGALEFPAFDLNNDGNYDDSVSGRASDIGIMPTISLLSDGAQDIAFGSGASGDIDVILLSVGLGAYGRQSWRQLK